MHFPGMYRYHPELALRYLPIVKAIKNAHCTTVAEVGSGGLGVTPYLKQPVIGIDLSFQPPFHPKLTMIKGSGISIPLKNHSVDAVICSDMLEHVTPEKRQAVITQLFRVARKIVIIGVPVGDGAHQQDKLLDIEYQVIHGHRHHFLEEQTDYGVPTNKTMQAMIAKAAGNTPATVTTIPNLNLRLRLFLMRGWISKNPLVNIFHRKLLLLALPILSAFAHKPPTYRQIFVITLKNH